MDAKGGSSAPSFVDRAQLKRKQALISFINARQRSLLTPAKRVKIPQGYFSCCSGGEAVVENYNNFRKSGIPARVMYFCKGDWMDFPFDVTALLKQAFQGRKSQVEVVMAGLLYLVDFLRMLNIDLKSGSQRSIAWIDAAGKCFFPRVAFEGESELSSSPVDVKLDPRLRDPKGAGVANCKVITDRDPKSVDAEDSEQGSSNSCDNSDISDSKCPTSTRVSEGSVSFCAANEALVGLGDNLIKLEDGDQEFMAVRNRFLAGLSTLVTFTNIVGIYRHSHSSVSGQSRFQAFRGHTEIIMRKNGGNANIGYAWHGTSRSGVCGIIKHGFGQPKTPKHGAALGNGVYLAPENCSYVSATYSDVDENGEQHMVLCRVILGNVELVRPGSQQFHPSSEEFDTGVDDLMNPRRYIVWSTHMNTHILPEYVVSFKVSPDFHEYWSRVKARQYARSVLETDGSRQSCPSLVKKSGQPCPDLVMESQHKMQGHVLMPTSAWMSFPRLFGVIEKFLSSSSMSLMKKHYADYKESKISREDLIRRLRMIAGDRLLISAIKMFRGQVHPPMNDKMNPVPEN